LIRSAADEDLDNHLLRGLRRRLSDVDVLRVQDVGLAGRGDHEVLAWAAEVGRILLTHDAATMIAAASCRIDRKLPMPGLIVIPQWLDIGRALDDLVLIAECSFAEDWANQIRFLPLKY
jgi:hypothetical protein